MIISIIVPVYNVELYLKRCMEYLLNQTWENVEILLIDDGSKDKSGELCDYYSSLDSRVKTIHKENGGLSDARNVGIQNATGEYVVFVDSDDYIEKDLCDSLAKTINSNTGIDVISYRAIKEEEVKVSYMNVVDTERVCCGIDYVKSILDKGNLNIEAWLYCYKLSFLLDNDLFFRKGLLHEDFEFTPRALLLAKNVVHINNIGYHYIIRENSISTAKDMSRNAMHMYSTCLEHEKRFGNLRRDARSLVMDQCVITYLSAFSVGKMIKRKDFIDKRFVLKNAHRPKTIAKSILFCISPKLYFIIHERSKS